MATLVLTAVGTAVGGPIGGAVGALLGGAVDGGVLMKPKGRQGPRLTELAVQTSSYGTPIPRLFGTMRVAGSVIWSTDLVEHVASSGGGKRGPSTTSYSYTASFAVLLSARGVLEVRRIWADGKLLRGGGGDLKAQGRFRLHLGGEEQAVDPLIASAEGVARAPAHRGSAYAVFEDLALADFGNRIPSLTFEVVADTAAVRAGAIIETVTDGAVAGSEVGPALLGYSAYGDSVRGVVDALTDVGGAWIEEEDGGLVLRAGTGSAVQIEDAGLSREGAAGQRGARRIAPADLAPRSVSIAYYDAARDYQTGLQRTGRPGAGERAERIELPAVLDASAAKSLASTRLNRFDVERERRRVVLDWRSMGVNPGARVTIAGERGLWRIAGWSLEAMVLALDLVRIARVPRSAAGSPGRVVTAPDRPHGPTIVHAFEMPPLDDSILGIPRLTIAAAGVSHGWRRAALSLSVDGGRSWAGIGETRGSATLGWVVTPPAAAPSTLADHVHALEVVLAHEGMVLNDADVRALDGGANLALVGDELLQFARAERFGDVRWRLTGLWRGRRGTEWAAGGARAGQAFVLIEPAVLATVDLPLGTIGSDIQVMASGIGDGVEPPVAQARVSGNSVVPPSPVHLSLDARDGVLTLRWIRRSRGGWRWIDGVDAPLNEEAERYRLAVSGLARTIECLDPHAELAAAPLDGNLAVEVRQLGTFGASTPATGTFSSTMATETIDG